MLLENTQLVACFNPSMFTLSIYSISQCLISTGSLQSLDGLFGAVILDGKLFITLANKDYIPLPPFSDCHIKLHAITCYGDDDPTQWAQPYIPYHSHMAAIPCPNMLLNHQIIWWTPTIADLSCLPLSGPMSGLWKLCPQIYNELRTSVIFLTDHITKYQQSVPDEQHSFILQPPIKWIQQLLDQLHSVQMSFCYIEFVV